MVRYRGSLRSQDLISGVNITPFTDVVLVLLIVFMISAPGLFSSSLQIRLPGASTAGEKRSSELTVGVDAEGSLYLNGKPATVPELKRELSGRESGKFSVVLNADMRVHHGRVVEVMDLLRKGGAGKIYVGTVKK